MQGCLAVRLYSAQLRSLSVPCKGYENPSLDTLKKLSSGNQNLEYHFLYHDQLNDVKMLNISIRRVNILNENIFSYYTFS